MDYSIVDFVRFLRVDRCKIRNTPNLIFLCGGKTAEKGKYQSARDYFFRHLKTKASKIAPRVRLAEDVNAWFDRDVFPDLLELENYLADLADITILFVESPGSIAELGAFAASDVLRPKTLAVLNNYYDQRKTFISDGPVQKIRNENSQFVHNYDWNPRQLNSNPTKREFKEMADSLTKFLVNRDRLHAKEQSFDKTKSGHVLLMVADLIGMAGVATTVDIAHCLKELGCDAQYSLVDRYVSLLESMTLITRTLRSNQAFYVSATPKSFIRYAYQPNAPLKDPQRVRATIRASLESIRRSVLSKSMKKLPKKGMGNG
jgi:hypothetical protein